MDIRITHKGVCMRTTMILDEGLLKELMAVTGAKTRTQAITELIRRRKREGLKGLSGKVRLAENWAEVEEAEVKEQERQRAGWRGHR